jgi:copper chaperone CopZ
MYADAHFQTLGPRCPACDRLIESAVRELYGVADVRCDHASRLAWVRFDPSAVVPPAIEAAINAAGFEARRVS